jgi:FAD/FMN-containing dehydrogenase
VVTSLRFRPVPDAATTSFSLSWPAAATVAVVTAWQDWAPEAPDELSASLLLTATDHTQTVHMSGAMRGSESGTRGLLGELVDRAGVDPESTVVAEHGSTRDTKRHLAVLGDQMHSGEPGHPYCTSEFFAGSLPREAVAELVGGLGRDVPPGEVRELDFMPMGGAYNRVPASETAFVHRTDRFLLKYGASVPPHAPAAGRTAAQRWLAVAQSAAHRWGTGRAYQNFPETGRDLWSPAYHGTNLDRLLRIKQRYDPDGFFDTRKGLHNG